MTTAADRFFSSTGGSEFEAWKFDGVGSTLAGEVLSVGDPYEREKLGKPNETETTVVMEIRDDQGVGHALYVTKFALKSAIADAVRAATGGPGAPAVGGRLGIQRTADKPPTQAGRSPQHQFVAQYVAPVASAATNDIFATAASPAPAAVTQPAAVPAVPPAAAPPAANSLV